MNVMLLIGLILGAMAGIVIMGLLQMNSSSDAPECSGNCRQGRGKCDCSGID